MGGYRPLGVRAPHAPAEGNADFATRPARILVVEDDYFVALELEHSLGDAGFEVVGIAATAEDALDLAAAKQPELAVVDIRLNGPRDGVDLAIDLFSRYGIRSVFATAHGDPASRRRAEAARPLGWLQKPYSPVALVALINDALAAR